MALLLTDQLLMTMTMTMTNDNDKVFYSTLIIHFISHITVINALHIK